MFATRRGTLYKLIQRLWQRCRPFLRHDSIFLPSFLGGFLFLTLSLSLYLLLIHSLIQCVYESLFLETSTFGITKRTLVIIKDLLPFVVDQPHQLSVVSLCPLKKQNKMHQVYLWTQAFFNCEDRLIRRQQQKEKEKRDNYRSESLHQSFEMNATRQWIGHQS